MELIVDAGQVPDMLDRCASWLLLLEYFFSAIPEVLLSLGDGVSEGLGSFLKTIATDLRGAAAFLRKSRSSDEIPITADNSVSAETSTPVEAP